MSQAEPFPAPSPRVVAYARKETQIRRVIYHWRKHRGKSALLSQALHPPSGKHPLA
jgi:hypothetical protein